MPTGPAPERTPVEDASQVATARAMAVRVGRQAGLAERTLDTLALVATELAENLHRHAGQGELLVLPRSPGGERFWLLALDRGPGVARFEDCLVDGYSTAGTMGTGLGAVQRMSDDFDAVSEPGRGTVVAAGFRLPGTTDALTGFDVGAVGFPVAGETRNGDALAAVRRGRRLTVLLADGLGHGHGAADAGEAAAAVLHDTATDDPVTLVEAVNERIAGTRGAAVSVAVLDAGAARAGGQLASAGLGNVAIAVVRRDGETRRVVTTHGTAGGVRRARVLDQRTEFPAHGLLVLHSDGLTSRWSLDGRAELLRHRSQVVAAALWRDHARGTDDALVVVAGAAAEATGR